MVKNLMHILHFLSFQDGEELMPYSLLFGFLRVQNIWMKTALGRVKNNADSQPKLHLPFFGFFDTETAAF